MNLAITLFIGYLPITLFIGYLPNLVSSKSAYTALNHLRFNRMPIFTTFNKLAFAKFLEVCFLFSKNKYEYDNFKQYLSLLLLLNSYIIK